ncbi:MGH1-like glycoside hydrolase domain-containing protein [Aestuariivivens insulae]|uniref:MGH1-like glycoside hydrolase domain-containing protein n=1 Tax=Aestuariivivens insulae TaxID=1621988 RepID=UPI001F567E07|nr:trehalase family glycosidase [Aestuariivivens insulae]
MKIRTFTIYVTLLCLALLVGWLSCKKEVNNKSLPLAHNNFMSNVLNLKGVPNTPQDRSVSSFTDLGSWHAFALPNNSEEFYGSFIGPFSMDRDNGIWLGKTFAKLSLYKANGDKIQYVKANLNQYPGYLEQHIITEIEGLEINLKLWFYSSTSVLVSAKVQNNNSKPIALFVGWEGDVWLEMAQFNSEEALKVTFSDAESVHYYQFDRDFKTEVDDSGKSFVTKTSKAFKIQPNTAETVNLQYSSFFQKAENQKEQSISNDFVVNSYNQTINRWKAYHEAFPYTKGHWLDSLDFELLKTKAIQTLIGNWKTAEGELKHDGLFPSYLYQGFHGFWAWDSWKHAVALARFEPKLAKAQVLAMFDYQDNEGMIADCVFRDTLIEKHNWRDTKPPLATWAVNEIFEQTGDTVFVKQMFPKLLKYHNWWYANRDHDGNKLCEYGSTDGTRIAAAWESGMDNAVRFDEAQIVKNNSRAWSLNQESVDLNAYLVAEKKGLVKLARVSGNTASIDLLEKEAEAISEAINTAFFNDKEQYYFDRNTDNHQTINVIGPEGWLPLWANIATSEKAKAVKNKILDQTLFNSKVPFPTLNITHKDFDPQNGYWRGPVWLDQAYFAIVGLENYGYKQEAIQLKEKLIKNAEGLLEKGYPIRENYHPITGEGLNANHFSWSAAHVLLLIE